MALNEEAAQQCGRCAQSQAEVKHSLAREQTLREQTEMLENAVAKAKLDAANALAAKEDITWELNALKRQGMTQQGSAQQLAAAGPLPTMGGADAAAAAGVQMPKVQEPPH